MKKGIIALLVISIMLLIGLTKVNASTTGVSSIWQGDMWNQNGNKLNYGTFGFQDQFDATQGGGSQRTVRTIYFNSALSTSGGGLPIQDGKDYISFRYTIWTPLITSTTNDFAVSFLFWTQNSWGAGANCEVVSDSDVYLNNASKIVKMYVIKCPILNNSSTISALNISFNATGNTLYNHELSGDVLQYSSVSVSDQQIINSINNQTQQILEQNATYQDTPSEDMTNETQELDNFEQAEQGLLNSLDLNMSVMDGITINPNASAYIWQVVERLRQINPAIILLMTSILGMGIIKMVLNR